MQNLFVWATIPIKPEFYEKAKAELHELAIITRKEKDCLIFQILESKTQPNALHLYEHWQSEEALNWHLEQDYTLKVKAKYDLWLSAPLEVTKAKELKSCLTLEI